MNNSFLTEKFIQTEAGKIVYYSDLLFSNKPTIIFLHGLSSNHTTWIDVIANLHKHNYNSIAWDMRGHGLSDKQKNKSLYNLSVFTQDLKQIVYKEGIKKAIIVGYSYGGSIAINYALKYPDDVSGLILISANHTNPFRYWKINFLTPLVYWFLNLIAFLLLWQKRKKYYYYQHGQSRGYWHSTWEGWNTMPMSVNIWLLMQFGLLDLRKELNKIYVPTFIIRAKGDPFFTEAETNDMKKAIQNSEIITPKHTSHFLATRSQEEITGIILSFLKLYANSNLY